MTEQLFENGLCCSCKRPTRFFCDECNKWICESHMRAITVSQDKVIHLCLECAKHVKEGVRIGGIVITRKMLPELD